MSKASEPVRVDADSLPRLEDALATLNLLRAEARARGIEGHMTKDRENLLREVRIGSVLLSKLPEYHYLKAVKALMKQEEDEVANKATQELTLCWHGEEHADNMQCQEVNEARQQDVIFAVQEPQKLEHAENPRHLQELTNSPSTPWSTDGEAPVQTSTLTIPLKPSIKLTARTSSTDQEAPLPTSTSTTPRCMASLVLWTALLCTENVHTSTSIMPRGGIPPTDKTARTSTGRDAPLQTSASTAPLMADTALMSTDDAQTLTSAMP
eukprot:9484261-Pyramimonas_sp.AAC.1